MKRYRDKISRSGARNGMLSAVAVVLLSLLAFVACTDEQMLDGGGGSSIEPDGNKLKVQISVSQSGVPRFTAPDSAAESRLDSVTILVFKKDADLEKALLEVALTVDLTKPNALQPLWNDTDSTLIVELKEPLGAKIIYAIANWDTTGFAVGAYSVAELNKEVTTIAHADSLKEPFPMLMSSDPIVADDLSALSYKVSANLVRQLAKLRMTISAPTYLMDSIRWDYKRARIWVYDIPTQAFVTDQNTTPLLSSFVNQFMPYHHNFPGDPKYSEWESIRDMYINPNMSHDSPTYIIVRLPYLNKYTNYLEEDNFYKLYFNTPATDKTIKRNTLYDFNIKILGYGLPINGLVEDVNVASEVTILPWENVVLDNVGEVPQKSFKIDRTLLKFQYLPETQSVAFSTDVEDWKLIYEDGADGRTIFSHADVSAETIIDGVKYTYNGAVGGGKITVEKLPDVAPKIPTGQQFHFVAQNLKVPFKVGYNNGVLLPSMLPDAWKVSAPNGIQIAKMGNRPPSQSAAGFDFLSIWCSAPYAKMTATQFGTGPENTRKMREKRYEAPKQCDQLGAGWYIPSSDELSKISDIHRLGHITGEYSFPHLGQFWTSSEWGDATVYFRTVTSGGGGYYNCERSYYVRCIKNL